MNEERKKRRDFFEIIHGIRPKRPAGAYKIFLSEKAKEDCFKGKDNILKRKKIMDNLSEDDKNSYLKKAKKNKIMLHYIGKILKIYFTKNLRMLLIYISFL